MESVVQEVIGALPDPKRLAHVAIRLVVALAIGAVIGFQREAAGKAAGLRTHMLVALGTALFVVASTEMGMGDDAMSRVIQGLATGIGFLGAGTILKLTEQERIRGLTTAAGIWMTAAVSVTAGLGQYGTALIGAILAWIVLSVIVRVERRIGPSSSDDDKL